MVEAKYHPHPDIKDYKAEIVKRDKKLLTMGYDGNLSKDVCAGGIHLANDIINRCAVMLK